MTAAFCTSDGCREPAAARVGRPLMPYPPGRGLGFVTVWPIGHAGATGLPMCIDCTHTAVDVMLMAAQPGAAS